MWSLLPLTLILLNGIQTYILSSPDIFWYLETFKKEFWEWDNEEVRQPYETERDSEEDKIWLLDVVPGDEDLRGASAAESEFFERSFGDLIELSEHRRSLGAAGDGAARAVRRSRPKTNTSHRNITEGLDDRTVLDRIRTTVNKFVLSSLQEREQHLEEYFAEGTDPSISVYIKSPYSAIVISYGDREWNFFLRPPSPLPAWLYKFHKTAIDVKQNGATNVNDNHKTAIDVEHNPNHENTAKVAKNQHNDMAKKIAKSYRAAIDVDNTINDDNTANNVEEDTAGTVMTSKVNKDTAIDVKTSGNVLKVPADVKSQLNKALLRYLNVALRFDLS